MSKGAPTPEQFDKLLRWLDSDRDKAGEKYERIRLRLIKIFAARGCYEAEELADETINVVASKTEWLLENYEGDPALYFYAVGKKIHLEWLKRRRPIPSDPLPDPDRDPVEIERVCGYLDECLDELPSEDKDLVLRYQQGEKQERIANRKKMAEELKITRNALRIKIWHLHSRLKECIERHMGQSPAN
jgi:hypothetical protein